MYLSRFQFLTIFQQHLIGVIIADFHQQLISHTLWKSDNKNHVNDKENQEISL